MCVLWDILGCVGNPFEYDCSRKSTGEFVRSDIVHRHTAVDVRVDR